MVICGWIICGCAAFVIIPSPAAPFCTSSSGLPVV